jgi:hypothetical protein
VEREYPAGSVIWLYSGGTAREFHPASPKTPAVCVSFLQYTGMLWKMQGISAIFQRNFWIFKIREKMSG